MQNEAFIGLHPTPQIFWYIATIDKSNHILFLTTQINFTAGLGLSITFAVTNSR